ncbi:MAG: hypothetical protein WCQ90_10960 [Deltaproteobacteria bacterium]
MTAKKVPIAGEGTGRTSKAVSSKAVPSKIGRDASTGKFVPANAAKRDPKHTIVETVKNPPKKK